MLDTGTSYRYQPELVLNEDARAPNRRAALAANAHRPNFESLMTFPNLPQPLAEALSARGYAAPTPVQAAVIEPEALGRDLIVSAQTGSGKTVAFGLAMSGELMPEGTLPPAAAPLALIIAPTRELALQVSRELQWLYAPAHARIATCVGGMDASRERRALSHGTHIVVGTPGRLRDHLERGALDLSSLKFVVLDEADEMLDMGFREDLEQILDGTPSERRTLLFSATMPRPIVQLAKRYQTNAKRIETISEDKGHADIAYQAVTVAPADIEAAVVNLLRLHEAEVAILFCATRDNVRHLHASLVERGFSAVALSGEHSQNERNHALQALRDGRARVCVATDVAARGIDLPGLTLVIHVEIPRDAEALQHRSGRTGRAGRKGTAILIVPYPRRRRVEGMLRGARIDAEWRRAPTLEEIREQDRERLLTALLAPVEVDDADRELATRLLAEKSAEEIAAALVRAHRAALPQAEELVEGDTPAPRERREGFDDTVWFRMSVGRSQNADPRWLLPLICRRGHITRNEIGAIRIQPDETMFEIPSALASRFVAALKRTEADHAEDDIAIEQADGPPAGGASHGGPRRGPGGNRPMGGRPAGGPGGGPRRYSPRPTQGGPRGPRRG